MVTGGQVSFVNGNLVHHTGQGSIDAGAMQC